MEHIARFELAGRWPHFVVPPSPQRGEDAKTILGTRSWRRTVFMTWAEDDMQALLVVDAQNEFSADGQRAVRNHASALRAIARHVDAARRERRPIAWVQHHNRPDESPAFVPGTWGAELSPGFGPRDGFGPETLFRKDVFGAFTGTALEGWLRETGATGVLIVGFYTHMCVSTSAREALVRGFDVEIDHDATGARALSDPLLGTQSADEVRRSALLQLANMGATIRIDERDAAAAHAADQLVVGQPA